MQGDPASSRIAPFSQPATWTLGRLQAGDQLAWREAYRTLWPIAIRTISRRIFSQTVAEDLAQETLTIVHHQINKMTDERHIRVMTVTIAHRRTSHFLRDETAARRDRRQQVDLDAAAEVVAAIPQAQAAIDLEIALANLDPLDRDLLEGHFLAGLKSHELANRHNLNPNTVRSRMKRSIDRLKTEFGQTLHAPTPQS
ncbi:MAG TPA: sigma-70 family RNA polymerase sigma factor [Opitutus sp.]|nr:sigma-70 family RNA polymerase sigma factor [Opitutus sp.]